jgi:hypothetical protein
VNERRQTWKARTGQQDVPHAKFVAVRLSDDRRPRCVQQLDGGRVERRSEALITGENQQRADERGERFQGLLWSMAEEHVVGIFLVHMLSLAAIVMPSNGPSETGPVSSGTTYTSAFTLAFFFSTA